MHNIDNVRRLLLYSENFDDVNMIICYGIADMLALKIDYSREKNFRLVNKIFTQKL